MPKDKLLTGPSCPKRNNLHSEKAKNDRPRSDIVSLSSDVSEDFIAFSDIPITNIMKVEAKADTDMNSCKVDNEVDGQIYLVPDSSKPQGSRRAVSNYRRR